jgi:hypothetical protein
MSERPTPQTDANESITCKEGDPCIAPDFARQLERERDEARELARELRDAFERFYGFPNCSRARLLAQEALAKAKEVLP